MLKDVLRYDLVVLIKVAHINLSLFRHQARNGDQIVYDKQEQTRETMSHTTIRLQQNES